MIHRTLPTKEKKNQVTEIECYCLYKDYNYQVWDVCGYIISFYSQFSFSLWTVMYGVVIASLRGMTS